MINKILPTTALFLGLSFLVSCSSINSDSVITTQEKASISSFEAATLNNLLLGSFNNIGIFLRTDIETAFKSEKEAINYVLKKQNSRIFLENKVYAVIEKSSLFYVYEVNSKNTKLELESYADLRNIVINKKSGIKLNSIVSQEGNIRFYSNDSLSTSYSVTLQPDEIINRLKIDLLQ